MAECVTIGENNKVKQFLKMISAYLVYAADFLTRRISSQFPDFHLFPPILQLLHATPIIPKSPQPPHQNLTNQPTTHPLVEYINHFKGQI